MRKATINRGVGCATLLAVLAVSVGPVLGQPPPGGSAPPPKKTKSQLEEWLERAARNHPDVKVAEAKLRTAAAELERARSQVMQQVLSLHYAIQAQKIAVDRVEIVWQRTSELYKRKQASAEEFAKARSDLIAAKAKLAELQAQVGHLVGKPKLDAHQAAVARGLRWLIAQQAWMDFDNDGFPDLEIVAMRALARGPMAERIRKALNQSLSLNAQERTLAEVLNMIRRQQPDLVIQVKEPLEITRKLSIQFTDLSLGAALQLLEDTLPGQRIVVREYGLLIAPKNDVPVGSVPLVEFWKSGDKPKK